MTLHADRPFPRAALIAGAGLMLASLGAAATARYTDTGVTRLPPLPAVESRSIAFADRNDGAVVVSDVSGDLVAVMPSGEGGFLRGVMRGFARDRKLRGIGPEEPFVLMRRTDGRLSLTDPSTDRVVELDAFGPANVAVFARLLTARETKP
jgi:putative photosynthetic complex assembly protein